MHAPLAGCPLPEIPINVLAWLIVGSTLGWLASMLTKVDSSQGLLLNSVCGMLGAGLGAWFLSPLCGLPTIDPDGFSVPAMGMPLLGAGLLLTSVSLLRRCKALVS